MLKSTRSRGAVFRIFWGVGFIFLVISVFLFFFFSFTILVSLDHEDINDVNVPTNMGNPVSDPTINNVSHVAYLADLSRKSLVSTTQEACQTSPRAYLE